MEDLNTATAILYGRDHLGIGRIGAVAQGPAAIAISRGGAPKTYHYKDPNEDAAAFALGPGGLLLAVADAHGGCGAAEVAVEHLVRVCAPVWTRTVAPGGDWTECVHRAIGDSHMAILQSVARGGVATSRTTLAFALIRPGEDRIAVGAIGDSHVFRVAADAVSDLARPAEVAPAFLGGPADTLESLAPYCVSAIGPASGARAVMVLSDGLSERGIGVADPDDSVAEAVATAAREKPALRPIAAARGAIERALAAHVANRAGDNVACASAWLGD